MKEKKTLEAASEKILALEAQKEARFVLLHARLARQNEMSEAERDRLAESVTREAEALETAESWGCMPTGLSRQSEYNHIFSHVEWHMTGYYITCEREAGGPEHDFVWADPQQMEDAIPLPSAFRYL